MRCTSLGMSCLLAVAMWSFVGCGGSPAGQNYEFTRFSMDTAVHYTVGASSASVARRVVLEAEEEMNRVSSLLWEEDSSSAIFRFNRSLDSVAVESEVLSFVSRSVSYSAISRGAFDITIKPVLSLYRFGEQDVVPPVHEAIDEKLDLVGIGSVDVRPSGFLSKRTPDVSLAVGGVAKGYAVDRAVRVLRESGVTRAVVNAGGDLYCLGSNGPRPWRVGVRDPDDPDALAVVLEVSDAGVATSGDYQRYFDHEGVRYHHILDPKNGLPARGVRSATVVAPTTEEADALATALFVLGPADGLAMIEGLDRVEGLLIDDAGTMHTSSGLARYLGGEVE